MKPVKELRRGRKCLIQGITALVKETSTESLMKEGRAEDD